jgi:hypothetical protein
MHSPANFDFALIADEPAENEVNWARRFTLLCPYLPARVLVSTQRRNSIERLLPTGVVIGDLSEFFDRGIKEEEVTRIADSIWARWLTRWQADKVVVGIGLDQGEARDVPTATWHEVSQVFNPLREDLQLQVWAHEDAPEGGMTALLELGRPIVYDRHATFGAPGSFVYDGGSFYESFDKGNQDFQLLFSPRLEKVGGVIRSVSPSPFLLAEAGLTRILVIDERIAERTHERIHERTSADKHELPRGFVAGRAGIWVATHFGINAEPSPIHRQVELLQKDKGYPSLSVEATFSERSLSLTFGGALAPRSGANPGRFFDIAIIHQGMLETFLRSANSRREFVSLLAGSIPLVVVTSGRGIPVDVQRNRTVKFLPFSLLERYVLGGGIAKIRLTSLCMKLTRWSR